MNASQASASRTDHAVQFQNQLAVIVPAYNERATIASVTRTVVNSPMVAQIIVVDDGSDDGTADTLRQFSFQHEIVIVHHAVNRGKGAAIQTALPHVRSEFTAIQDADLEYDPSDYGKLLAPLLAGQADVIFGSRYLNEANDFSGRRRFDWGVKLLNLAVRLIYGVKITDEATCYKVFPTSLLRAMNLECERFEFCPEVTAKACRLGLRIKEVPIRYSPRAIADGKKVRLRDGLQALWTLWKYRKWQGFWERDVNAYLAASDSGPAMNAVDAR